MTIDFSRSFVTFRIDAIKKPPKTVSHQPPFSLNNARIQLECVCWVTEKSSGCEQRFVLGASCKTERVGVDRDIWTEPNADFAPIFSDDGFMHLKTFALAGVEVDLYPPGSGTQSDRQTGKIAEMFDSVRIDITECEGEVLSSAESIVLATLANKPLVARTQIENDRYVANLEYPVKTINANERDMIYQTDTGPVLVPDLESEPENLLPRMELGFAAFNCPTWIELLVRVPTKVSDNLDVYHYSQSQRYDSKNEIRVLNDRAF
jgi:hypothetical protein